MATSSEDHCRPQQTHISYGRSTTEIVIMWSTKGHCTPQVVYGTGPFQLNETASGESRLLSDNHKANETQAIHKVTLKVSFSPIVEINWKVLPLFILPSRNHHYHSIVVIIIVIVIIVFYHRILSLHRKLAIFNTCPLSLTLIC